MAVGHAPKEHSLVPEAERDEAVWREDPGSAVLQMNEERSLSCRLETFVRRTDSSTRWTAQVCYSLVRSSTSQPLPCPELDPPSLHGHLPIMALTLPCLLASPSHSRLGAVLTGRAHLDAGVLQSCGSQCHLVAALPEMHKATGETQGSVTPP